MIILCTYSGGRPKDGIEHHTKIHTLGKKNTQGRWRALKSLVYQFLSPCPRGPLHGHNSGAVLHLHGNIISPFTQLKGARHIMTNFKSVTGLPSFNGCEIRGLSMAFQDIAKQIQNLLYKKKTWMLFTYFSNISSTKNINKLYYSAFLSGLIREKATNVRSL